MITGVEETEENASYMLLHASEFVYIFGGELGPVFMVLTAAA
jgi:hypothetical protein